jgi:hypothetical protein
MRRYALALVALIGVAGCFGPPSPSQRLADSAYETNYATRFGRMDVALANVALASRAEFARAHAGWGRDIRVVDVDFSGMNIMSKEQAEVYVTVAWQRPADPELQVTNVVQRWRDDEGGWRLVEEKRASGSFGLLADEPEDGIEEPEQEPVRTHFPTRVIQGG